MYCNIIYMKRTIFLITFLLFCFPLCFSEGFEITRQVYDSKDTVTGDVAIRIFITKGRFLCCTQKNGSVYFIPKDKIEFYEIIGDLLHIRTVGNNEYKYSLKNYKIELSSSDDMIITEISK